MKVKKVEFDYAEYGTIGLESAFGALQTIFSTEDTIKLLTSGRALFGSNDLTIKEGVKANITLFNPDTEYYFLYRTHTLKI